MIRHWFIGLLLLFATLAGTHAAAENKLEQFSFSEPHMGTTFQLILYADSEVTAKKAAKAAFARVAELNRIMSDYLRTSELMKLCDKAGSDPIKVSKDLFDVLQQAKKLARQTDGAFDVSVGPIVRLWRRARRSRKLPTAEALKDALARVGWDKIKLDKDKRKVHLLVMGMLLDLGGIAKGYAADAALAELRRFGIKRALVSAGGDITVGDAPPDEKGWRVGVAPLKNPDGKPTDYLLLTNASVATSGDASRFVLINGTRYSHIVSPQTGLGLVGRRSVTVIAKNGAQADSLATAVCVMGPKKGLALISKTKDVAALYVFESDGKLVKAKSKNFDEYLLRR